MASTKTRAELVAAALADLGVLQAGQDPSAEDADAIDGRVDGVLARLSAKGVVTVQDDEAIPVEWLDSLARILADDATAEFGQPRNPMSVMQAENDLRVMTRLALTHSPLAVDYF